MTMSKKSIETTFQNNTHTSRITIQLLLFVVVMFLAISPTKTYAQAVPNLLSLTDFALFTGVGALANTGGPGSTPIIGDIGTNVGAISNYPDVTGTIENANARTAQGAIDVQTLYDEIANLTVTVIGHAPVYGSVAGETLFAGVYGNGGAGSTVGTLILDAQGDPNALFVFVFPGGAFSTGPSSEIQLINGAQASNVFWSAVGAISFAAGTIMKGTTISVGAGSMAAGASLEGRMLSTNGAIATDQNNIVGVGASTGGTGGAADFDGDGVADADDNCPNTTAAHVISGHFDDCTVSSASCGCTDVDGDGFFPDAATSSATYDGDDNDAAVPSTGGGGGTGGCTVVAPTLSGN